MRTGTCTHWDAGQPVGAVVHAGGGGLVLTASDGFLILDTGTGAVTPLAPVEADEPGHQHERRRLRPGRPVSTPAPWPPTSPPGQGALYRLDPDLTPDPAVTGVGISNGIGWSPDDPRMYYVDSLAYQIDAIDYDPATGEIGAARPLASLGRGGVMPDGLTVDADGYVWVAVWGGGAVQCYRPDGAAVPDGEVPLPTSRAARSAAPAWTCCTSPPRPAPVRRRARCSPASPASPASSATRSAADLRSLRRGRFDPPDGRPA